jgi:ABC-type bacteriocin/lantibiotic exporter with double-glycine peptidase domain
VAVTWLLVLIENALLALIPLFIGRAIDALLANESGALWEIAGVMLALVLVASARRAYDTRCYGTLRVTFGAEVVRRIGILHVSQVNARLDMSREMVDFLEEHVPGLLTAIVQMTVSILVLWAFDQRLGASAVSIVVVLVVIYALFHRRFYRLNSDLNTQREQQVAVLEQQNSISLLHHLKRLRIHEVRLSDSDVLLYAAIFSCMFAFILINLWAASTLPAATAGLIFSVISYSWELVESCVALPLALQQWSRLTEIRERLNKA